MLVQITLEILFQNEQSTVPSLLIITLTIYLPCLFERAEETERMVSDSFREVLVQFNITCFGRRAGAGLCTYIQTVLSKSILHRLVLIHIKYTIRSKREQ